MLDLQNGDQVSLILNSSELCLSSPSVESAPILITVSMSIAPTLEIKPSSPVAICEGESVTFEITSGNGLGTEAFYTWFINGESKTLISNSTFTFSSFSDGDLVTVKAENLSSCANATEVTSEVVMISIVEPVTPSIEIQADQTTSCKGDIINFTIKEQVGKGGNPLYTWLKNGVSVGTKDTYSTSSLLGTDKISVVMSVEETCVTDQIASSEEFQVVVLNRETPTVDIQSSSLLICDGDKIDFSIKTLSHQGDNPTYSWYMNDVFTNTGLTYSSTMLANNDIVRASLTSSASCLIKPSVNSNVLTVIVNSSENTPTLELDVLKNPICEFEEIHLTATSSLGVSTVYEWTINDVQHVEHNGVFSTDLVSQGDVIKVKISSISTCGNTFSEEESITVQVENYEVLKFFPEEIDVCSDKVPLELSVSNLSAISYSWTLDGKEISNTNNFKFDAVLSGEYGIRVKSPVCGVSNYPGVRVDITNMPIVSAGKDLTVSQGSSIVLQGEVSEGEIIWVPSVSLDGANLEKPELVVSYDSKLEETTYVITATNGKCVASDEMVVSIYKDLIVYSAFSPNSDGVNDVWNIPGIERYPKASVRVFNRWGQEVFVSYGYSSPWNGTYKGNELPLATYYYVIQLNDPTAVNPTLEGSVNIIK